MHPHDKESGPDENIEVKTKTKGRLIRRPNLELTVIPTS